MKVVINGCFGGFNISDECAEECIKRGMTLTTYNAEGNYENDDADICDTYSNKPDGYRFGSRYDLCNEYKNRNAIRTNPILVEVVEKLGSKKASGSCAKLKVIEIPFDSLEGWFIDEYDGLESVKENHKEWSGSDDDDDDE